MGKNRVLNSVMIAGLLIIMLLIGGCIPGGETAGEEGSSILPMVIFLVLIFGMMYLVLIRPQRKKQKEHQQMVQELKRGDRVVTAGGIYGQIDNISEDSVVIKVESGMTIRVAIGSVALKRET